MYISLVVDLIANAKQRQRLMEYSLRSKEFPVLSWPSWDCNILIYRLQTKPQNVYSVFYELSL